MYFCVIFTLYVCLPNQDVQQKVRPYILALDMSHFKYDDFIRVLDTVSRYVQDFLLCKAET